MVPCRKQGEPQCLRLAPIAGGPNIGPMLLITLNISKGPITIAIKMEIVELQIYLVSSNGSHHINTVATVPNPNMFLSIMRFAASSSVASVNTVQGRTCDTPTILFLLLYSLENQL